MPSEERKVQCLERFPPGDRWIFVNLLGSPDTVFESLTEALEAVYQETDQTKFYIDAREGAVYYVTTSEVPEAPPRKYSIYGDEM